MSTNNMMKQHTIVDIDDYVHVIDGKVICYEPNTIDFTDKDQVNDFFDMIAKVFTHELLQARYGKNNTCVIISGIGSNREKIISMSGMHHFPPELMEKIKVAVCEYEEQYGTEYCSHR